MNADELRKLANTLNGIADGKPWQVKDSFGHWSDAHSSRNPTEFAADRIRLKPWELGRTVNGHTLPDGRKWMRPETWTEDRLPRPFRPLMIGEYQVPEDEELTSRGDVCHCSCKSILMTENHRPVRTTRPIPFTLTLAQIADGWLPWSGGECPVEPESRPTVMFRDGKTESGVPARTWTWERLDGESYAIVAYKPDPYGHLRQALAEGKVIQIEMEAGRWADFTAAGLPPSFSAPVECYRIKEPQWLPLGPEDVPPFSLIRRKGQTDEYGKPQYWHWRLISYVTGIGPVCADRGYNWQELSTDYEINRPRHRDADGNPTLWEPCRKQAP